MTETIHFVADAALIDRLGRELVARQETALIELVKNAYDADASEVTVTVNPPKSMIIEDNGIGMTHDELVNGFMRLANANKIRNPRSREYQRQRAGRKGIGRFSTQRLGERLRVRTWTDPSLPGHELVVDWSGFVAEKLLEEVPVTLREIHPREAGTELMIEALRDPWTEAQIRRCWRGLIGLQQPFPVMPIEHKPGEDPGFQVRFVTGGSPFLDPGFVADMETEILNHAHAQIEFRVDGKGRAEWRMPRNTFGPERTWKQIHHDDRDARSPKPYSVLRDVAMRTYYFNLHPSLLPKLVFPRVRDVLRDQSGIRVYRNGFRVVPYGDPGDDWLELDKIYSQRGTVLAPIRNLNFFGIIEIHDVDGERFDERSSREGLFESLAFMELKELTSSVIISAVQAIAADRGRKSSAGGGARTRSEKPTQDPATRLRQIGKSVRDSWNWTDAIATDSGDIRTDASTGRVSTQEIADLVEESAKIIEEQSAELADESTMLRLLATLGLTAAEFSHETGMTFDAVRLSLRRVFEAARAARVSDKAFQSDVDSAEAMISRLDSLTSYVNSMASSTAIRELTPVSVTKQIRLFVEGMQKQAKKQEVTFEVKTDPLNPLFTKPMHEADLATILLNFYSNSVKAMRRARQGRRVLIEAYESADSQIVIRFSDTGDGIPQDIADKIFDPFFTTRAGAPASASQNEMITGTGLGLWIVHQVVSNAKGQIEVVPASEGYATCLEVRLPSEEA